MLPIPREMDASFDIITTAIVSAGDGHDVHVFGESEYICPMRKKIFQS
jgi:hypothetical protein